jgi:hypothetical protein
LIVSAASRIAARVHARFAREFFHAPFDLFFVI